MLHDGYDHVTDTLMGMKTGDPRNFKDIEDVKEAFKKQLQFFLSKFVDMYARTLAGHAYTLPTITGSTLAVGCMEKGKLLQQKGSDPHYTAIAITGMANVIDSLEP